MPTFPSIRRSARVLVLLPCALAFAGCSGGPLSSDAGWFQKPLEFTSRPSWLFYSDGRDAMKTRPVGPEDLVSADGACAAAAPPPAASAEPGQTGEGGTPAPAALPALAPSAIGLDMTECEVVRRAGHTNSIQIANNERGERTVVMTYMSGPSPGIYRFTSGRLTSIERVAQPEPPPRQRKPTKSQQKSARS